MSHKSIYNTTIHIIIIIVVLYSQIAQVKIIKTWRDYSITSK